MGCGGKKKKKWLIFGVIGGIVAVVGVVALVLAIILTSEPKTGAGIKAKNYEEAFNIYANYFLFGEIRFFIKGILLIQSYNCSTTSSGREDSSSLVSCV